MRKEVGDILVLECKEELINQIIIGSLWVDVDEYGRLTSLHTQWYDDELIHRIDDAFEYTAIFDDDSPNSMDDLQIGGDPPYVLISDAKFSTTNDGGLIAELSVPLADNEPNSTELAISPPIFQGKKKQDWLEYHGENRTSADATALYAYFQSSANTLVVRTRRKEPILQLGSDWDEVSIPKDLSNCCGSDLSSEAAWWTHVALIPNQSSIIGLSTEDFAWPRIEISILINRMGFVISGERYFGAWKFEDGKKTNLFEICKNQTMKFYDLKNLKSSLPTNFFGCSVLLGGKFSIWQTSFQSSCGYQVEILEKLRFELTPK